MKKIVKIGSFYCCINEDGKICAISRTKEDIVHLGENYVGESVYMDTENDNRLLLDSDLKAEWGEKSEEEKSEYDHSFRAWMWEITGKNGTLEEVSAIDGGFCTESAWEQILDSEETIRQAVVDDMDYYGMGLVQEYMDVLGWDGIRKAEYSVYQGFQHEGVKNMLNFLQGCEKLEEVFGFFPHHLQKKMRKWHRVVWNVMARHGIESYLYGEYFADWAGYDLAARVAMDFAEELLDAITDRFNSILFASQDQKQLKDWAINEFDRYGYIVAD